MNYTKISKFIGFILFLLFVISFSSQVTAQKYSIDRGPQKKLQWNFHPKALFKKDEVKRTERKQRKEEKKKAKNELKIFKKNWKRLDHPKELGSKRKVVKRMKKNLKVAKRVNHNKHKESKVKRLSRKKIKLPKISITKIHWPWMKKSSNE